jgi:beta-glucosidase
VKSIRIVGIVLVLLATKCPFCQKPEVFRDPHASEEARITDLLMRLTLEEKISFFGVSLNVPRLHIHASGTVPSPIGTNGNVEGLHGVALGGPGEWGKKAPGSTEHGGTAPFPTTQYPQAAGLGNTWDPILVRKIAAEEGEEARYVFTVMDRGGLIVRAPNADLARDPRWGRTEESFGEDPFLTGTMATSFVEGLQGRDPLHWQAISMLKHFMANSNEDNRRGSSSNFSTRLMQEYYAAPFRMAIEHGHANAIMASYNAVNGVPMTSSPLLKSLLIDKWGFNGLIATDRGAVTYMVDDHKAYPDLVHAVVGAVHAGINQFLNPYVDQMRTALQEHLITEADLDANLRGLFRVLLRAGLLKDDRFPAPVAATQPWDREETKRLVLQATRESVVLLKNTPTEDTQPLLPISRNAIHSIAVLGPLADVVQSDWYGGTPPFSVTPLQGLRDIAGTGIDVRYSAETVEALQDAKESDLAVVFVGSDTTCSAPFGKCPEPTLGKEAVDRKQITLDSTQEELIEKTYAANPRTIIVLVTAYPYAITWAQEHVSSILQITHSSEEEGRALAEVLFGNYSPSGRLVMTWPKSLDQLPPMMDYNIADGRTYMYFKGKPLYAFGHGLSYTHFEYGHPRLNSTSLHPGATLEVEIPIRNIGHITGDDVVQLYVHHIDSSVQRPQVQLKGFKRISLKPGESKTIHFKLAASDLSYWGEALGTWTLESDRVELLFGEASDDIRQRISVAVSQ